MNLRLGKINPMISSTKDENYISKCYLCDELFNLNVMNAFLVKDEFSSFSITNIELSNVWHGILGHANIKMIKWDLILKFEINVMAKCKERVHIK